MKLYWKSSIKKQNWIQTYLPPLSCAASPRQPSLSSWTNPQISWKTWSLTTPHRLLFLNSFYFKVYQTHRTGVFSAGTTEDLTTDFISVPIPRIWSEMNPLSLSSEITTYCNEIVQNIKKTYLYLRGMDMVFWKYWPWGCISTKYITSIGYTMCPGYYWSTSSRVHLGSTMKIRRRKNWKNHIYTSSV